MTLKTLLHIQIHGIKCSRKKTISKSFKDHCVSILVSSADILTEAYLATQVDIGRFDGIHYNCRCLMDEFSPAGTNLTYLFSFS